MQKFLSRSILSLRAGVVMTKFLQVKYWRSFDPFGPDVATWLVKPSGSLQIWQIARVDCCCEWLWTWDWRLPPLCWGGNFLWSLSFDWLWIRAFWWWTFFSRSMNSRSLFHVSFGVRLSSQIEVKNLVTLRSPRRFSLILPHDRDVLRFCGHLKVPPLHGAC